MLTLYGIPNCDTVKKTRDWLDKKEIDYQFHNYKTEGISKEKLATWIEQVGLETILNKKSTTWKGLSPEDQAKAARKPGAIKLMVNYNSLIKRPVLEQNEKVLEVGFKPENYAAKLSGD